MREKSLLMVVLIGFVVFFMGCAGEEPSKGEVGTPEATMTETPKTTMTETPKTTMTEKPTVTATPESKFDKDELTERIDKEINEKGSSKYTSYVGNIYINYGEDRLFISYSAFASRSDNTIYGWMLSVMEVVDNYILEKDLEVETVKFRVTDRADVEYSLTIERTEMQKFLNGTWGFSEWQEMTEKTGEE